MKKEIVMKRARCFCLGFWALVLAGTNIAFSDVITNIGATASSSHPSMGPKKTVDGSGLNGSDQHSTEGTDMWLSSMGDDTPWIQYEFDRAYTLDKMWVWNSNQFIEPFAEFGAKDVSIQYSTNGSNWVDLSGEPKFSQAPGASGYAHNTTVDFYGVTAKYVKLIINSNYGSLGQCGISEVRFFASELGKCVLLISSSAGGSVTVPGEGTQPIDDGQAVALVAQAEQDYHFVNWTGSAVDAGRVANPSAASTTVTVDSDYTLRANFAANPSAQHTLMISSSSGGFVTSPGEGSRQYGHGISLPITAMAYSGYHFVSWTGTVVDAGSVSNPSAASTIVTVNGDHTLVANFAEDQLGCPSISTYEAEDVTGSSARLKAYLADDGGEVCEGWFSYWEKNSQAQTELDTPKQSSLQKSQQYVRQINGLLPGTAYCFQAIVENSDCLDEGNIREFTTLEEEIPPANIIHVDDDAINDPGPSNLSISDPQEDGTEDHPYDSILEAIEQAKDLDRIRVHEGMYRETLDLMGKCLDISSFSPNASDIRGYPVIDAQNEGTVVSFNKGEDPNCVLSGFVLTGGLNDSGSAIACIGSSPTIRNCLIVGNRSSGSAGAIIYCEQSHSVFENCTIADNYAGKNGAALYSANCNLIIANSILWGNLPGPVLVELGTDPVILYTDVQGTYPGVGNIDSDPLFAKPGYWADPTDPDLSPTEPHAQNAIWIQGDYHLLSEKGCWDLSSSAWIQNKLTSPCIDEGDPDSPWAGEPQPHGAHINMGAYGGTNQASCSLRVVPIIAHWPFDESSGATAYDAVGNNHGTVYGASWTEGLLGGALHLDGLDDYVDLGNDPALASDLFTISLWIYTQASSGSRSILRKAGGDKDKDYDFKLFAARNPTFSFGDGLQTIVLHSSSAIPSNEWTHIALTRDETEATIHVNGTQLVSKTYDFAPSATHHKLIIGGGSLQPYQGRIDDVRFYGLPLSAEDIRAFISATE